MKILFIAPIPPPIDGQSKASKVLLDKLIQNNAVTVVDLNKKSLKNGNVSFLRIKQIGSVLNKIFWNIKNNDIIYLSLAESFAGNMRDIFIYCLCLGKLDRLFIHMLGGAGMKNILTKKGWQTRLNAFFMKKLAGVIVEGPVNFETFRTILPAEKIHIVPNFAEDFLFVKDEEIEKKFQSTTPIEILYLSNLIPGKGFNELVDSFLSLTEEEQSQLKLNFVGGFESEESKNRFLIKIKEKQQIKYLGKFIDGMEKRDLYAKSHVFCLPTYYPFEGQPISILEAYATGCVVITTNHSGIPFVFKGGVNGFVVEKKSVESLTQALRKVLTDKNSLKIIAFNNRNTAEANYRTHIYQNRILELFEKIIK